MNDKESKDQTCLRSEERSVEDVEGTSSDEGRQPELDSAIHQTEERTNESREEMMRDNYRNTNDLAGFRDERSRK